MLSTKTKTNVLLDNNPCLKITPRTNNIFIASIYAQGTRLHHESRIFNSREISETRELEKRRENDAALTHLVRRVRESQCDGIKVATGAIEVAFASC